MKRCQTWTPSLMVGLLLVATPAVGQQGSDVLPGTGDDQGKIVVYRDSWGVPHVYAPTVEDGLFAQGWAQAQDRPQQVLLNMLIATGELSSVLGQAGVQSDLRSHLFDHYGAAQRAWDELRPELKRHLQAFAGGINAYYASHPEDRPPWWQGREVDPRMVVAFGRLFLFNWSIDEAYGDLRRGGVEPGYQPEERGSNQFAVAPSRSAEGAAILAIDPHLPWIGPRRFWEMRVHAGEWEGSGVTLPGVPYIGLGHTRHLAWAMTTGGPDTADVYELTLDPENPSRYRFDDGWRELESREVTLRLPTGEETHTLWFSHHGPLIARDGDRAWAASLAYADVGVTNLAWYELNFGRDYTAAIRAFDTLTLFLQNVMVVDSSGNLYYQRTGRVPRRPDGYDWSRPVDGSTSASGWQGFHPASDFLQLLNPPQGWMQNCNVPPDAMMPGVPFDFDETVDYLYGSREYGELAGWTNQRGARAIELLAADDSVTAEEAIAYINDVTVYGAERWIAALAAAHERFGNVAKRPGYREGLEGLLAWDRRNTRGSTGALRYDLWRHRLLENLGEEDAALLAEAIDDHYAIVEQREPRPPDLEPAQQRQLVEAFADAMADLLEADGSLDATFGDRHRVARGGSSWPVGGSGDGAGTMTLRALRYGPELGDETVRAIHGQTSTQVVVMSDPPRSWIYLPLGQSDRPGSPHFADQAETLFSERRLKSSWWLPEELRGHVESRTVLERPSR